MAQVYPVSPESTSPSNIRYLRDEGTATYDVGPSPAHHFTYIEDDVLEEVAAKCGPAATGIYAMLERMAGKDGKCFPSHGTLAGMFGCSDKHIQTIINDKLAPAGFVIVAERHNRFGRSMSNEYYLPFHRKARRDGGEHMGEVEGEQVGEVMGERDRQNRSTLEVDTRSSSEVDTSTSLSPADRAKLLAGFTRVVTAFPKRPNEEDEKKAKVLWAELDPDEATIQDMLNSIPLWQRSKRWHEQDGKYRHRFLTWLQDRCWEITPEPNVKTAEEEMNDVFASWG